MTGQYRLELGLRHPAAAQHTLPLHIWRGCNHSYYVGPLVAACLEQQGDIEHDNVLPRSLGLREESALRARHDGMHDAFELFHRFRVLRDLATKLGPVDPAIRSNDARKGPFDRRNRFAAGRIGRVNRCIGVVDRDAARGEHGRRRRLAHADGACECELDHARAATASRQALSAPASSGDIPNQIRKAAAACPTNMGNPS